MPKGRGFLGIPVHRQDIDQAIPVCPTVQFIKQPFSILSPYIPIAKARGFTAIKHNEYFLAHFHCIQIA